MSLKSFGIICLACLFPVAAATAAEGIKIVPGKWKVKNTRTSAFGGSKTKPMKSTDEHCMGEMLTVDDLTTGSEEGEGCQSRMVKLTDDYMEWEMSCPAPGGTAKGTSVYEVSKGGTKVTGTTKMKVTGQMTMTVENKYVGTHKGDCD